MAGSVPNTPAKGTKIARLLQDVYQTNGQSYGQEYIQVVRQYTHTLPQSWSIELDELLGDLWKIHFPKYFVYKVRSCEVSTT